MSALLVSILVLSAVLLADSGVRGRLVRLYGSHREGATAATTGAETAAPVAAPGASTPTGVAAGRSVGGPTIPMLGASALAGLAAAVVIGGAAGWLVGPVVGVTTCRVLRNAEPAAVRERRFRMEQDLPMTIDVFAACLSAGASPERALRAIASADPGPLGRRFEAVAEQLANGVDPRDAWAAPPEEPRVAGLAVFERAMTRAADSGIPLVAVLDRLADDVRAERRAAADRRARSVGVRAAAPLGLCFLPAFVLVGIVPMVATSLRGVL